MGIHPAMGIHPLSMGIWDLIDLMHQLCVFLITRVPRGFFPPGVILYQVWRSRGSTTYGDRDGETLWEQSPAQLTGFKDNTQKSVFRVGLPSLPYFLGPLHRTSGP